jgi:hypothetical protein
LPSDDHGDGPEQQVSPDSAQDLPGGEAVVAGDEGLENEISIPDAAGRWAGLGLGRRSLEEGGDAQNLDFVRFFTLGRRSGPGEPPS